LAFYSFTLGGGVETTEETVKEAKGTGVALPRRRVLCHGLTLSFTPGGEAQSRRRRSMP
jgi:hypothetical protein